MRTFFRYPKSMQPRDEYLRFGDACLRHREEGAGPVVVFVHGWTLDLDAWEPQAAALSRDFRVVRYDRRGFGLSGGEPGLAADVRDLAQVLDRLAPARPVVVGHSQGARVALACALAHPGRLSGLVLDGPPDQAGAAADAGDGDFSLAEYRDLVAARGVDAFRDAWRAHPLMRLYSAGPDAVRLLSCMLARYPARDLASAEPAPAPADAAALARLTVPVLVINGEFETISRRRAADALVRALPEAEHVILQGAGHLPNLDDPDAYNGALRAFLDRRARAAA
jgi:pimeloyl-ACP methyl ester carboxylesterase